tara:strand:- start:488 stop:820 length:333 start_codon:yes stop_codon:yes gene_type:complete
MGNYLVCEKCNTRGSSVKVGYRCSSLNVANVLFDASKPEQMQQILRDSVQFGHKHWEIKGIEDLLFYEHICRECYTLHKDKVHCQPPEGFTLELDVLPEGKYYRENVALP